MIDFNLKNRVAVITGGAQGFGFAIAKKFVASGANVIIWDINEEISINAVKELGLEKSEHKIVDVRSYETVSKSLAADKSSEVDAPWPNNSKTPWGAPRALT